MKSDERVGPDQNDCTNPAEKYERLLSVYLDRLNNEEFVDPDEVLLDHPDVGERLVSTLEAFLDLSPADEMTTSLDSTAPLGTLAEYTLLRQIGRGGMGVVYEAWEGSMDRVVALKVRPSGVAERLACGTSEGTLVILEAATGERLEEVQGHTSTVMGLSFSPSGRRLASGSCDHTMKIWDPDTAEELMELRGHAGSVLGVSWHPHGDRLLSMGPHSVRIWEVRGSFTVSSRQE